MAKIFVGPADVQAALDGAGAGDEIVLRAGLYGQPLTLARSGTPAAPIILSAEPGAVIDGGRSADEFKLPANRRSREVQQSGQYPGLWRDIDQAYLKLLNCSFVEIQGINLRFRQCWPTALFLRDATHIRIDGVTIDDATFAIGALGGRTRHLKITNCVWRQDVTERRLWREILWSEVHGDQPVADSDWRLFDGDFFRSAGIAGDVEIACCRVSHAFNAVHGFNDADDVSLNRNFDIHDNHFSNIRDNVFEPERTAFNWWFYRNTIFNCHKWFSVETKRSGFFYIFGNCGWFDEIPGPVTDGNRGGGVFKTPKERLKLARPHYVFHNSFNLRSDYIRNWVLNDFHHFANAIRYGRQGEPAYDGRGNFFGNVAAPADDLERRFTTSWAGLKIGFADDIVDHRDYVAALVAAGYGPFTNCRATDPQFRDPIRPGLDGAGFEPIEGSPARAFCRAVDIVLPDGSTASLPSGRDAGAWQGNMLFGWQAYRPMTQPLT